MVLVVEAVNVLVCLAYIVLAWQVFRVRGATLLVLMGLIFLLSNVIGISVLRIVLSNNALQTGNVDLPFSEIGLFRQAVSSWLVCGVWMVGLWASLLFVSMRKREGRVRNNLGLIFGAAALLVAIAFWSPFMLFGPGLSLAWNANYISGDFAESMQGRAEFRTLVDVGVGYFRAQVSAIAIFPLAAALMGGSCVRKLHYNCFLFVCFFCSISFAIATRQKAPVLLAVLQYLLMFLFTAKPTLFYNFRFRWRYVALVAGGGFVAAAGFYRMTEGEGGGGKAFARVFVTPVASAHLWFASFPDVLSFRGISGAAGVASPAMAQLGQVTIRDVARAATGVEFSANAAFPAIAWSAAGFTGVLIIAVIVVVALYITDVFLRRNSLFHRYMLIALSAPLILPVTSGSLLDMLFTGVFLTVPAYALLARS